MGLMGWGAFLLLDCRFCGVEDTQGPLYPGYEARRVPPLLSVSVVSKELSVYISGSESTLERIPVNVDSKGTYVALKLCKAAQRAAAREAGKSGACAVKDSG